MLVAQRSLHPLLATISAALGVRFTLAKHKSCASTSIWRRMGLDVKLRSLLIDHQIQENWSAEKDHTMRPSIDFEYFVRHNLWKVSRNKDIA